MDYPVFFPSKYAIKELYITYWFSAN